MLRAQTCVVHVSARRTSDSVPNNMGGNMMKVPKMYATFCIHNYNGQDSTHTRNCSYYSDISRSDHLRWLTFLLCISCYCYRIFAKKYIFIWSTNTQTSCRKTIRIGLRTGQKASTVPQLTVWEWARERACVLICIPNYNYILKMRETHLTSAALMTMECFHQDGE